MSASKHTMYGFVWLSIGYLHLYWCRDVDVSGDGINRFKQVFHIYMIHNAIGNSIAFIINVLRYGP